jgi:predicted PhzF superfamily epimerase YddE/YHI9
MITIAADEPGVDFVSRYFAPAFGIDEDPATGLTHCRLGPFWSRRLNKSTFVARQVSERRGMLKVAMDGVRVRLGGQAVTVLRGELLA